MKEVAFEIVYKVTVKALEGNEGFIQSRINGAISDEIENYLGSVTEYSIGVEMGKLTEVLK